MRQGGLHSKVTSVNDNFVGIKKKKNQLDNNLYVRKTFKLLHDLKEGIVGTEIFV